LQDFLKKKKKCGVVIIDNNLNFKDKIVGRTILYRCDNVRKLLALSHFRFCNIDTEHLRFIGITGTNGKTSSALLTREILKSAGYKVGFIGTGRIEYDGLTLCDTDYSMTTPDPWILYPAIKKMQSLGCEVIVMEVSSHALALDKVAPLRFEYGIFTNLSPEHLDFHSDIEEYYVAKKKLLTCKFTYSIYNNSRIPELTVGDRIVKYSSATWKVQTANGEFVDVPCNNGANAELEAFNAQFSFSQKPDAASVRVRDKNDAELYNADLAAFGSFTLARSGELTVDVTAFWYQQSDRSFYGTVTYTYTAYFTAEPRFEMNAYEAQPGGTLLLSCINIPEAADIGAKIGERPVNLYRNGENVYAFVAFPYDTVPGQYSINITVADKVHKIAVTVTDKKFSTTAQIPVNMMPADRFSAAASEDAINEYRDLMKAIGAEKSGELRYDGTLLDYQLSFVLYKGNGL
jgi:hypothetical protein